MDPSHRNRVLILSTFLILSLVVFLPIGFVPKVEATPNTEYLYVDGWGQERDEWTETGTSPYLDAQDEPTNYIDTATKSAEEGDFTFENLTSEVTITQVKLEVYCNPDGTGPSGLLVYIWDGADWQVLNVLVGLSYAWHSRDVTEYIDSYSKVNEAKVYFMDYRPGAPPTPHCYVDCARLNVTYAGVNYPQWLECKTEIYHSGTDDQNYSHYVNFNEAYGQPIVFRAHVQQSGGENISGFKLCHNNSGTWINETWVAVSPLSNDTWIEKMPFSYARGTNEVLNTSLDVQSVGWLMYFNNTLDYWNKTDMQYVTPTVPDPTGEMIWVFSETVKRKIAGPYTADNPPYVKLADESYPQSAQYAGPDMLSGIQFYEYTENVTYLDECYETAEWLNNTSTNIKDLFFGYDWDEGTFPSTVTAGSSSAGIKLMLLCQLVEHNSSYMSLLKNATAKAYQLWLNQSTYRVYTSVQRDETITDSKCKLWYAGPYAAALAWAGNVTDNATYRTAAVRIFQNWTYGDYYIPHEGIMQDGTPYTVLTENVTRGWGNEFLRGMNVAYYYTRNDTLKDLLNRTAWYTAQAFYSTPVKHLAYKVNVHTGMVVDSGPVHCEGITQEALFVAGLIMNNLTWIDKARQSFDTMYINISDESLFARNLVAHSDANTSQGKEVTWGFNVNQRRMAYIWFCYMEHNLTYKMAVNRLYTAATVCHKKAEGYANAIYWDNINSYYNAYDLNLYEVFKNFANTTYKWFTTFDGFFRCFGGPWVVESKPIVTTILNLKIMDWDLTDAISGAKVFAFNEFKISNPWANWTEIVEPSTQVNVSYYGYCVNGTFTVDTTEDKTLEVHCKIFDIYVKTIEMGGGYLTPINVTVFNSTTTEKDKICTGITNSSGWIYLQNVPNATLRFTCYTPTNTLIENTTAGPITTENQQVTITCTQNAVSSQTKYILLVFISSIISVKHKKKKGSKEKGYQNPSPNEFKKREGGHKSEFP